MFKEILLPVDLQETALSERAIAIAQDVAEHYDSNITVITVIPDFGLPMVANFFPEDTMKQANKEVCAELKRFVAQHFRQPDKVKTDVRQGSSPHKAVVKYADKHHVDLIIIPSRAKDVSKLFLGSSATHVVERAPCSVMVVRP